MVLSVTDKYETQSNFFDFRIKRGEQLSKLDTYLKCILLSIYNYTFKNLFIFNEIKWTF